MAELKSYLRCVAACGIAAGLAAFAACAFAGPQEDYAAGAKAYRAGDVSGAMALLRKSADAGHAPSQVLLADILDKAGFDEEAVAYYRKAAGKGSADGEFGLGAMYASGEGVKRDLAEARKWFTRAAEKGHSQAVNVLAQAYMRGELGLDERGREGPAALAWIRRAADNGYVPALQYLARAYRAGELGLAIDVKQAEALEARAGAILGTAAEKGKKRKKQ